MVYKEQLLGKKVKINDEEIIIENNANFDKWIQFTENKLSGQRKKSLEKQNSPNAKLSYEDILLKYFTAEDVYRNLKSSYSVYERHVKQGDVDITTVKLSDVRKMAIELGSFAQYEKSEVDFIKNRLEVYKKYYYGDTSIAPNDEFDLLDIVDLEREIEQLKIYIRLNPRKADDERKNIEKLREQRSKALLGLNIKKQQRDKKPVNSEDDLLKAINEADKSVSDLEVEVSDEDKEEEEQMKKKRKRDSKIE